MVKKENIRKALEKIAQETKIDLKNPDKLYAIKGSPKEIESEDGSIKVRVYGSGVVEIYTHTGQRISFMSIYLDELQKKVFAPKGATHLIHPSFKNEEGDYIRQKGGSLHIDGDGFVVSREGGIRVNTERIMEEPE